MDHTLYSLYYLPKLSRPVLTKNSQIASASGDTSPPQNSLQPNGDPIPWGVGQLASPSNSSSSSAQSGSTDTVTALFFPSFDSSVTKSATCDRDGDVTEDEDDRKNESKHDRSKGNSTEQRREGKGDRDCRDDQNAGADSEVSGTSEYQSDPDGDEDSASTSGPEASSPSTDSSGANKTASDTEATKSLAPEVSNSASSPSSSTSSTAAGTPPMLENAGTTVRVICIFFCCHVLMILLLLDQFGLLF